MEKLELICMLILSLLLACQKKETIYTDIKESDANDILLALKSNGLSPIKTPSKNNRRGSNFSISVNKKETEEALKILSHLQLPRINRKGLKEIFSENSSGLIPSKIEERAKLFLAMQGEIESLIKIIPGVIDTKVVFSANILDPPNNSASIMPKASAVVIVDGESPDLPRAEEIQKLVAGSVMSLEPQDILAIIKKNPASTYSGKKRTSDIPDASNIYGFILPLITAVALLLASYGMLRTKWPRKEAQK